MVDQAYERTKNILIEHKDQLTKLAELLLEKEVIFKEDLERVFGERKFESRYESLEKVKEAELAAKAKATKRKAPKKVSNNGSAKSTKPTEVNPVSETPDK